MESSLGCLGFCFDFGSNCGDIVLNIAQEALPEVLTNVPVCAMRQVPKHHVQIMGTQLSKVCHNRCNVFVCLGVRKCRSSTCCWQHSDQHKLVF